MSDDKLNYCWPEDFPEGVPDSCDVVPAEGWVYRLVRTIPPKEVDFRRHRDEKPDYVYYSKDIPKSYGVSFWSELSKIKRVERNYPFPEQYGNWQTVCGNLTPELGVIPVKREISGHITLWVQDGAEPHKHINNEVEE
ncbi:hypothetical protein AYI85_13595 [Shewanella algae]|uniref:hypothetical protein n=1 Tax=Shewanella algae TaxID=38313 RepID=UPI000D128B47|nr:hypothetical protein [Shewanella algae]MBO2674461.1 hypothetical protein [Shewanella algae]PSS68893.1 hypothetical protein AYI85_13595 [Shewanella algae]BCV48720.1 hypothetical protein TUM17382_14130 [Shewanella algae]